MAAPVLQRSVDTFRRSGSSGLVWEDRYFLAEDLSGLPKIRKEGRAEQLMRELRPSHSVGTTIGQMDRSSSRTPINNIHIGGSGGSGGGSGGHLYRSSTVSGRASNNPTSLKLPVCGFFGILGNAGTVSGTRKASSKPGRG
ncbi:hypothetical protein Taro_042215 [Colocasia esculenta]|uniref:Uncharacterized protein n=1 Tax=Colocasia esculenta TaxID=4460 RepID=A0A843WNE5_COLES|nr:hypothetical protein [Colocasia esculenta]